MNISFSIIEELFKILGKFIFIFPILGIIYFFREKKLERFILFIGIFISTCGIYFQDIVHFIFRVFNQVTINNISDAMILFGFFLILIFLIISIKRESNISKAELKMVLIKFSIFKYNYYFGLTLLFVGFTIFSMHLISASKIKPIIVLGNTGIIFTVDSIFITIGVLFIFISILGTIFEHFMEK